MRAVCALCPRRCSLNEGQLGFCRARMNCGGQIVCENYGRVTSIALDPIEKKPLRRFYPETNILSIGSYGCNMDCGYCQNHVIARADSTRIEYDTISPESLITLAEAYRPQGNIGLAFTYNEPLIGFEYVLDCAKLLRENGLMTVLVTNGMISPRYWEQLLPYVDAANIDLKAFSQEGYRALGGDLYTVQTAISMAAGRIHLEITTLIVPQFSDDLSDMHREAEWIASLSRDIPLHVSRFFPRHRMLSTAATPKETVLRLAEAAREHLNFVYTGNM